jgi:cobyric acid synthase
MNAQVIRNLQGESAYYEYLAADDEEVLQALHWLRNKSDVVVIDGRLTLRSNDEIEF